MHWPRFPFTSESHYSREWLSMRRAADPLYRMALFRRTQARATGQLWLLPEIEYAPFPPDEIPGPVYDRLAQLPLFRD